MNRVTHFEIYTDNPEAVQPFYREVFGWKFNKFEGGPIEYWLITTGDDSAPGINGGLTRPREGQSSGTLNTIAVASLACCWQFVWFKPNGLLWALFLATPLVPVLDYYFRGERFQWRRE